MTAVRPWFKDGVVPPEYTFRRVAGHAFRKVIKPSIAGVSWHALRHCWCATINVRGNQKVIGMFRTEREAIEARRVAIESAYSKASVV
jgi:hypothetical protein